MKKQSIFNLVSIGIVVWVTGVFLISTPVLAKRPDRSTLTGNSEMHLIGIIDPDGHKHVWRIPGETGGAISSQLAAKYPSTELYGVTYFRIPSWRGTSKLVLEINAQQDVLISDLRKKIKRLKKKTGYRQIIRRHGQHRNSKSLSERVYELERQMKDLTHDGGYL